MVHAAGVLNHPPVPTEQFFPLLNKGELAVLIASFSSSSFYGPGRYALDTLIFQRRPQQPLLFSHTGYCSL
jgi:hypothetical protein